MMNADRPGQYNRTAVIIASLIFFNILFCIIVTPQPKPAAPSTVPSATGSRSPPFSIALEDSESSTSASIASASASATVKLPVKQKRTSLEQSRKSKTSDGNGEGEGEGEEAAVGSTWTSQLVEQVHPNFAESYVLPSQRTVAENKEHNGKLCKKFLANLHPSNYLMWEHGFSQFGQDLYIADVFKKMKNGVFVDIGAYDGETHSNSALLDHCLNWNGILVEANPSAVKTILNWRPRPHVYHAAASTENKMCKFVFKSDDEFSGLEETNKHGKKADDKILTVHCVRPQYLFDMHNIDHVNYLSVDVEGHELPVLKSIDFDKTRVDVIGVEENGRLAEIKEHLAQFGFQFKTKVGEDAMFWHRSFKA
eukprot:ANDGO_07867.mRNA.1 hypothetical protein GUITHDRAFT_98750